MSPITALLAYFFAVFPHLNGVAVFNSMKHREGPIPEPEHVDGLKIILRSRSLNPLRSWDLQVFGIRAARA
jgi:hypothetical protein